MFEQVFETTVGEGGEVRVVLPGEKAGTHVRVTLQLERSHRQSYAEFKKSIIGSIPGPSFEQPPQPEMPPEPSYD